MLDDDNLELTGQYVSQQKTYIDLIVFKEINKEYLWEINYDKNNPLFNTFKGFKICTEDESDFELPNLELKKNFKCQTKV